MIPEEKKKRRIKRKVFLDLASLVADFGGSFHHSYGLIWLSRVAVRGWLRENEELTLKCHFHGV